MATPPPEQSTPGSNDDHQTPRWVKGFIAATIAAVLLVVVVLVAGGGGHGPSRHLPVGEPATQSPEGHTPPVDHG